jgi:two-component system, OmpR family, KDP operon response regulator KdpE
MAPEISSARILIVDDDPRLIRLLREVLHSHDYEVLHRSNGVQGIEAVAIEQPDLMLLEISLEGIDGYEVCRRVREFMNLPIIILSERVTENDMLAGFEAGADDYITKPFSSKELLVRVGALLNRARRGNTIPGQKDIICDDLCIELACRRVTIAGNEIYLTATEYHLLLELAMQLNRVVTHEKLLTEVWGMEYRDSIDYLRSYIHHLRKKLERDPSNPQMIINFQGVGYMLKFSDDSSNKDAKRE